MKQPSKSSYSIPLLILSLLSHFASADTDVSGKLTFGTDAYGSFLLRSPVSDAPPYQMPNSLTISTPSHFQFVTGGSNVINGFQGWANSPEVIGNLANPSGSIVAHQPSNSATMFAGNLLTIGSTRVGNTDDAGPGTYLKYYDGGTGVVDNGIIRSGGIWTFHAATGGAGVEFLMSGNTPGAALRVNDTRTIPGYEQWFYAPSVGAWGPTQAKTAIQLGSGGSLETFIMPKLGVGTKTPTVQLDVVGSAKISGSLNAGTISGHIDSDYVTSGDIEFDNSGMSGIIKGINAGLPEHHVALWSSGFHLFDNGYWSPYADFTANSAKIATKLTINGQGTPFNPSGTNPLMLEVKGKTNLTSQAFQDPAPNNPIAPANAPVALEAKGDVVVKGALYLAPQGDIPMFSEQ